MSDESRIILEMVRDGKISIEEAERLMDSIPLDQNTDSVQMITAPAISASGFSPKRIRILVSEGGKNKVNLKVPFSLVRAGLKIAQSVVPKYTDDADVLKDINIDEIIAALSDGDITLPYKIIDIDDDNGDHVEIVIE